MFKRILIANRGEIALRIVRAVRRPRPRERGRPRGRDAHAFAREARRRSVALDAAGPAAYLDVAALVGVARATACDAVHPGYGFLSERADFAQACADAGLAFIGPAVEQLALFGDKARARALAQQCGVPLLPGSPRAVTLAEAQAFFAAQGGAGVMIKAAGRRRRPRHARRAACDRTCPTPMPAAPPRRAAPSASRASTSSG